MPTESDRSRYLTVLGLLQHPSLVGCFLLSAATAARSQEIRWAAIREATDLSSIRPGELVMTTGAGFRQDPRLFLSFIETAARMHAAAVAVEIGVHITEIPQTVIHRSDSLSLPLVTFPWELRFAQVSEIVFGHIVERQDRLLARNDKVLEVLVSLCAGGDIPGIIDAAERFIGQPIVCDPPPRALVQLLRPSYRSRPPLATGDRSIARARPGQKAEACIMVGGRQIAALRLQHQDQADSSDNIILNAVANLITLAASTRSSVSRTPQEGHAAPILALLVGRDLSPRQLERSARDVGLDPTRESVVIAFAWRRFAQETPEVSDFVRRAATDVIRRVVGDAFLWDGDPFEIIAPASWADRGRVQELSRLIEERDPTGGLRVSAAIGSIAGSLSMISVSHQQATVALQASLFVDDQPWVGHYDELGALAALWQMVRGGDETALTWLIRKVAQPLRDYQAHHGVPLATTLSVFFDNGRNVSASARALHINRQTLLQRLARIEAVTGVDIRTPIGSFTLESAIRGMALLDKGSATSGRSEG